MGTPEMSVRRELAPGIAEKVKALELGRQVGREFKFVDRLAEVLKETRKILLPLVEWLDKPASTVWRPDRLPTGLRKKRILVVSDRFFKICLARDGQWVFNSLPVGNSSGLGPVQAGDSARLAAAITKELDNIWRGILWSRSADKEFDRMLAGSQNLDFLVELFRYNVLLVLFASMSELIGGAIIEREERLRLLRRRLSFFGEFAESLDPILASGSTLEFPACAIWDEYTDEEGHGHTSRSTDDYLCPEALEPFWKILKSRQDSGSHKEQSSAYSLESLKWVCDRIGYMLSEVEAGISTRDLFGRNSGRLPLSPEEIRVLKTVCSQFLPLSTV